MLSFLVAAGTGAALLLGRAPVWARILGGVAAVPVGFTVLNLVDTAAKAAYQADGWFRDELGLVVTAVVLGALALVRRPAGR